MNKIIKYDNDDVKECLLLFKNNKFILDGVYELHNRKGLLYDCVIKYKNDVLICRHLVKPEETEGVHHCIHQWEKVKINRLYYIPQRWILF